MNHAENITELIAIEAEVEVEVEVEEKPVAQAKAGKRKQYAVTASKGLGILLSVALTAYLSVQEAISDRPTKAEVKDDITEIKAAHRETKALQAAANNRIENRADALDKEVDSVEDAMISIGGKVDALDKKVSEGFADIKEELRYLRRKK